MNAHAIPPSSSHAPRSALWMAVGCYVAWGIFPLYWKLLGHLSALETLAHRFIWSFVFYVLLLGVMQHQGKLSWLRATKQEWFLSGVASVMLSVNWGVFIYAINTHRVLESSLAYFINPLFSVAIGVLWFHEPFPKLMKLAFVLACAGVLLKAGLGHEFPWISLALALSFCAYGVIKKTTRIQALQFSVMEASTALIPALLLGFYIRSQALTPLSHSDWALLTSAGVITGVPLVLFAIAAQRLPYSLMGMLQFLVPTLQFIIGLSVYHESLNTISILAFVLIWIGVGCYVLERMRHLGNRAAKAEPDPHDETRTFIE
jgi:chloramphenicol-sensitive protein RarD